MRSIFVSSASLLALGLTAISTIIPPSALANDDDSWGESETVVQPNQESFPSKGAGWNRHEALCHGSANCTVTFNDDGLKAGSLEIPSSRLAGWSVVDKSQKQCNMFGMCYRSVFSKERQEFIISYLNDDGKKSKLLVAFVNGKAAVKFRQDIEAFAQLAKASDGRKPTEYLSENEASKDQLTSTAPSVSTSVHFSAWVDVGTSSINNRTWERFIAPSQAIEVSTKIYEYPWMQTSEGAALVGIGRIDCRRSLVTAQQISVSGIDTHINKAWAKPRAISPSDMAFTAAQTLCR